MGIHSKHIQERVDWLLDLARKHSASYCSPESFLARERYLAEHPSAIVVLKCMDGRTSAKYSPIMCTTGSPADAGC